MSALAVSLFALVLAGAACSTCLLLYRKLAAAHRRIHFLERGQADHEQQVASLSRQAAQARALVPVAHASEFDCHSQHGEEYFLWELSGFKRHGTYVEIGAYDGVRLSNSLFFERLGWQGMLVEAHPELVLRCRDSRPRATVVHAALGQKDGGTIEFSMVRGGTGLDTLSFAQTSDRHRARVQSSSGVVETVAVPARTLASVLAEAGIDTIDWMSIDVEGAELEVLKGANLEAIRPKVLVVEDNSRGGDPAVAGLLSTFGYRRLHTVGCNDFYVIDA